MIRIYYKILTKNKILSYGILEYKKKISYKNSNILK